jgi:squalene synthase HpnC
MWPAGDTSPADTYLRHRERHENFPVALRLLPAGIRPHLHAVYDISRTIDDLGDEAPGDRTAALLALRTDLDRIWRGQEPDAPVLQRLAVSVRARALSRQPFVDLIEANLRDQTTSSYRRYDDLLAYCALSANPVGRIVLEVFGVSTPERVELSDRVCTALQIIEHCQDVAEDRRAGRVYLPVEDQLRFGVTPSDLDGDRTPLPVRRLVEFEARRALSLLKAGTPLLRQLRGRPLLRDWARLAVAGYVAGGRAAFAALRRASWSVNPPPAAPRKLDTAISLVRLYAWSSWRLS